MIRTPNCRVVLDEKGHHIDTTEDGINWRTIFRVEICYDRYCPDCEGKGFRTNES